MRRRFRAVAVPLMLAGVWLCVGYPYGLALFLAGIARYGALKARELPTSR